MVELVVHVNVRATTGRYLIIEQQTYTPGIGVMLEAAARVEQSTYLLNLKS